LNSKLTDKDKKDWKDFTTGKEKVENKDLGIKKNYNLIKNKVIDLHGFSLANANKAVEDFINASYTNGIRKITVITGKGKRSKTEKNPYLSKNLSILKYSVPEFIRLNPNLMKKIKQIDNASVQDGGSGAFYIYLKNFKE